MNEVVLKVDGQSFAASEAGFRWEGSSGAGHEGPWTRVISVTAMTETNRVEGVDLLVRQHLAVTLDLGETFRTVTRDAEAAHLAKLVLGFCAPHLTARVLRELERGGPVEFGAVSLSRDRLTVYGKSFALSEVAGHRTAHGHWMLDVGPKRTPRLAATVKLSQIPNHFALVAALEKLLPGSEYGEDCEWLGAPMRPSATSHDPRYLSTRAKLMATFAAGAGVLLLAALVLAGVALSRYLDQRRLEQARQEAAARIEKAAAAARALSIPDSPLACQGFPKDVDQAVFVADVRPGVAHPLGGAPYLVGSFGPKEVTPFDATTHLAFARVLTFSRLEGATYYELRAAVAVLQLDSLQVLCQGQLAARVMGAVQPEARLAEGLASAVCPASGAGPACQNAVPGVKPLPREEPKPETVIAPKPEPKPEPVKWAKGLKVEVERRGKWLPAVILQVGKRGIRVRYESSRKLRDETVPATRLRPRP